MLAALVRVRGERTDADGHNGRAREGPRGTVEQRCHHRDGRARFVGVNEQIMGKIIFPILASLDLSALFCNFNGSLSDCSAAAH